MSEFDYTKVTPADLEMVRLPRQSRFHIVHKPSGKKAEHPVVPGSLSEARFRRPTNLPKGNRVKGMEGYIEGKADEPELYIITDERNEYLDALAKDPEALKATFEGVKKPTSEAQPKKGADKAKSQPQPEPAAPSEVPAVTPTEAPEQVAPAATVEDHSVGEVGESKVEEPEEITSDSLKQIDDMLASLDQ